MKVRLLCPPQLLAVFVCGLFVGRGGNWEPSVSREQWMESIVKKAFPLSDETESMPVEDFVFWKTNAVSCSPYEALEKIAELPLPHEFTDAECNAYLHLSAIVRKHVLEEAPDARFVSALDGYCSKMKGLVPLFEEGHPFLNLFVSAQIDWCFDLKDAINFRYRISKLEQAILDKKHVFADAVWQGAFGSVARTITPEEILSGILYRRKNLDYKGGLFENIRMDSLWSRCLFHILDANDNRFLVCSFPLTNSFPRVCLVAVLDGESHYIFYFYVNT